MNHKCVWRKFALAVTVSVLAVAGGAAARASSNTPELLGTWGGQGIRAVMTQADVRFEFGCGGGTIDGPLVPDAEGFFEAAGRYRVVYVGPRVRGQSLPPALAATYTGWTDGEEMDLTVKLTDSGRIVGKFRLRLGEKGHIEQCL